ncbi:hypothetical protein B0H13DRAFT_2676536 [Mycena leptocephala]|nr:hypothetical protein B0H13DRAFT_2676536 [Mycena leptocephala]
MDEAEGVLGFTERGFITLGWTHPSQSCFMSSVDLHPVSEDAATVFCDDPHPRRVALSPFLLVFLTPRCSSFLTHLADHLFPSSFGIFRLTDPPRLPTVLQCTAKQSIRLLTFGVFQDADKGHVHMREAALEIVDLRWRCFST